MRLFFAIILPLFLFFSCKTQTPFESSKPADPQINPGSCRIEATIVEVLKPASQDTNDICFKNSCDAIVHVERIIRCGSSASVIPNEKGEITVHFPNSLNPPGNNSQSASSKSGLKTGSVFSAVVETRQAPGDKVNYVIYFFESR